MNHRRTFQKSVKKECIPRLRQRFKDDKKGVKRVRTSSKGNR